MTSSKFAGSDESGLLQTLVLYCTQNWFTSCSLVSGARILSIRTGRWIPPVRTLLQSAQTPHTACQGIHMELTQNFGSDSRYSKRSMIFQTSANYLTMDAFTLKLYVAAVCVYGRPLDSPWHTGQLWLHYPLSSSGCGFFLLGSESLFVMIAAEVQRSLYR